MTETLATGPLRLGDLLDRSFRLVRLRWWPFTLIAASLLAPYAVVSSLVTATRLPSSLTSQNPGDPWAELAWLGSFFSPLVILDMVVSALVILLTILALTAYTIAIVHGEPGELLQSYRQGLRRFWSALGLHVIVWTVTASIFLVSLVPIIVIVLIATLMLGRIEPVPGTARDEMATIGETVIGVALVLFVVAAGSVPAGFFQGRWLAALPALVAEGLSARTALGRSWRLSAGLSGRMMVYLLLLVILSLLVSTLPSLVVQYSLLMLLGPSGEALTNGIVTGISYLMTILWLPVQAAATVLLYYDLRARREGYDLSLRVRRLEAQVSGRNPGTMYQGDVS